MSPKERLQNLKRVKEWVKANPDRAARNKRNWYLKHKIKALKIAKDSVNKLHFGGLHEVVLLRDKRCLHCNNDNDLTVDHIDRNREHNTLDNLQTLCRSCHGKKDQPARIY